MQDVRLEALQKLGLVLLNGSEFFLNDFIFERPFGLQSKASLIKCESGGFSYVGIRSIFRNCQMALLFAS